MFGYLPFSRLQNLVSEEIKRERRQHQKDGHFLEKVILFPILGFDSLMEFGFR